MSKKEKKERQNGVNSIQYFSNHHVKFWNHVYNPDCWCGNPVMTTKNPNKKLIVKPFIYTFLNEHYQSLDLHY